VKFEERRKKTKGKRKQKGIGKEQFENYESVVN
jgi:hypothetical protein